MNTRQQQILKSIVSEHIRTHETVGSKLLGDVFHLSSATIRNEMAELEDAVYLYQPYTSAGRVPSEKGYRYYIDNFLNTRKISKKEMEYLQEIISSSSHVDLRRLAREIANMTHQMVFVAFEKYDIYFTGLSNLFSNPEFTSPEVLSHLGVIVDNFESGIAQIFDGARDVTILVGNETPFAPECSSLLFKVTPEGDSSLVGLLGPMRMDYSRNYSLLNYAQQCLKTALRNESENATIRQ